jgi:hypothetical protein
MNNNIYSEFNKTQFTKDSKQDTIIKTNTFLESPFILFQDINPNFVNKRNEMIKNLTKTTQSEISDIETLFFSDENIDLINKQLILYVWKNSNHLYKIGNQSRDKLLIVMRYVYLEFSKNLPYNFQEQLSELNCITVGEIGPTVITNFEQKLGYLRDIERRQAPLPLPQSTSKIKTLPTSNKDFFNN